MKRLFELTCIAGLVLFLIGAAYAVIVAPTPDNGALRVEVAGGTGSGVMIDGGRILTAAHVAIHADHGIVTVINAKGDTALAAVRKIDPKADLAILELLKPLAVSAAPHACKQPNIGTAIEAVGNPFGILRFIHTYGHVASVPQKIFDWTEAQFTDTTFIEGMSGGPVYDQWGTVVGIVVATLQDNNPLPHGASLGLFVPMSPRVCGWLGDGETV